MRRTALVVLFFCVGSTADAATRRWNAVYFDNRGNFHVSSAAMSYGVETPAIRVAVPTEPNGCDHAFAIVSQRAAHESACVGR